MDTSETLPDDGAHVFAGEADTYSGILRTMPHDLSDKQILERLLAQNLQRGSTWPWESKTVANDKGTGRTRMQRKITRKLENDELWQIAESSRHLADEISRAAEVAGSYVERLVQALAASRTLDESAQAQFVTAKEHLATAQMHLERAQRELVEATERTAQSEAGVADAEQQLVVGELNRAVAEQHALTAESAAGDAQRRFSDAEAQ